MNLSLSSVSQSRTFMFHDGGTKHLHTLKMFTIEPSLNNAVFTRRGSTAGSCWAPGPKLLGSRSKAAGLQVQRSWMLLGSRSLS